LGALLRKSRPLPRGSTPAHWLIEVKASDDNPGTSLRYYTAKLRPDESLQLVLNLDRAQEKSGIKVLPLGKWLEELPFQTNTGA